MEQPPQYWMWEAATTNHKDNKKQRSLMSTSSPRHHLYLHQPAAQPPSSSYEDSWEEQAFAEDAAGSLGGCIWPPRSYSCTFCRREFRSAQALGGHMNVHRRDRARLKRQSPASSSPSVLPYQFPSNSSPNPSPDPPPSPLPARVYADDANNCSEKSFFPSAAEEEEEEEKTPHGPTSSNSPPIGMEEGIYKRRRVINRCSNPRADSSAVSLNLVLQRSSQPTASSEEAAAVVRFKRKRLMEDNRDFPFVLMGLDSMPRRRPQEVFEMMKMSNNHNNIPAGASCFKEELDLELRLGDRPPPKVKSI